MIVFCLYIFLFAFLNLNSVFSQSFDYKSFFEKLGVQNITLSSKEVSVLSKLSPIDLEKLERVIKLIKEKQFGLQANPETCTTELCKKQKLLEKCTKEKQAITNPSVQLSQECKNLDLNSLAQLVSNLTKAVSPVTPKNNELLADKQHDANVDRALQEMRTNPPPPVPQSVINQHPGNIIPGHNEYLGDFVCQQNGGGSFNTRERPRNQGGLVQDELFYAIARAAQSSGISLTSLGCYNNRTIAGTNTLSQHAMGAACDVLPQGQGQQKVAFLVFFMANTGNFNSVGSYANRGFDHSHLSADGGGNWSQYQKGSGLESWKQLALQTVFQACGQSWHPGLRPPKKWVQDCAKKAVDKFCKKETPST